MRWIRIEIYDFYAKDIELTYTDLPVGEFETLTAKQIGQGT